ncbi:MAG: hypothetical protein EOO60_07605 [Hymenobacter sp.]|nr:MAG: hypothetical protein EOO60_07605 [Hymenobacter sp.]
MLINVDNKQIEAEKIYDRRWDGIIGLEAKTGTYYLCDLVWHGGGYVDRIKKNIREIIYDFQESW